MSERVGPDHDRTPSADLEQGIGRLLRIGTTVGVVLLAVGVVLMFSRGISPLDPAPAFDLGLILARAVALEPDGFIGLGLVVILATPALRVVAALIGFARARELEMTAIAAAVIALIGVGVLIGLAGR